MKHRTHVLFYLVLIVALTLSIAPFAAIAQEGGTDEPYKVGFVNHLTGDMAPYGQSLKKGTELAVDEINAAGGIKWSSRRSHLRGRPRAGC